VTFASEADLERALLELGTQLAFPETPDLATAVRLRLRAPRRRGWVWSWPRALAAAAAVAIVAVAVGLAAWPEGRQAVANRLGIGGVQVTHVDDVPTPTPGPTSPSQPPGASLGLGARVSLDEAQQRFGAAVLLPDLDLGPPDAVYVMGANDVSLVYARGDGLVVLSQFRASLDQNMLAQKGLGPGTTVEEVQVGASRGLWIAGAPHLFLRTPGGAMRDAPPRLAANTLLWEQNGSTLRLESGLDRDAAIKLAESVR
jgi:hypothetical protein